MVACVLAGDPRGLAGVGGKDGRLKWIEMDIWQPKAWEKSWVHLECF